MPASTDKPESAVLCAVRELREEAGVRKDEYTLLPGVVRRAAHEQGGVRYAATYYVAVAGPRLAAAAGPGGFLPGPPLADPQGAAEVGARRWHDIHHIRRLDGAGVAARIEALVAGAFRLAKTYWSGRWGRRRPRGDQSEGRAPLGLGGLPADVCAALAVALAGDDPDASAALAAALAEDGPNAPAT